VTALLFSVGAASFEDELVGKKVTDLFLPRENSTFGSFVFLSPILTVYTFEFP